MPSGNIHNASTLTVAATSAVIVLYQTRGDFHAALYCAGGALIALVINPDLDVDGNYTTFDFCLAHPIAWIWRLFWRPYAVAFRHRSVGSHFPILSTFIRGLYILLWIWPFWLYYGWELPTLQAWMLWGGWGLILADGLHWFLDFIDNLLGGSL